jgi:hypothetical protein
MRWALATIAPWCVASVMLMSFTASADVDASGGGSRAVRELDAGRHSYFVASPGAIDLAMLIGSDDALNALRAPWTSPPSDKALAGTPDGEAPNAEMKRDAGGFPAVERGAKGDPLIALRPALGARPLGDRELARISFGPPGPKPAGERLSFTPGDPWTNSVVRSARFAGYPIPDGATTRAPRSAFVSAADIVSATRRAALTATNPDGATPAAARAERLASTTPAPPDSTPIEVAAVPVSFSDLVAQSWRQSRGKGMTVARREDGAKPDYADLVAPEKMGREERCLAEAVYFEARGEPEAGQAAVAQVVLNRVKSGLYPSTICGVVYQNRNRYMGCQFSFACEGKSLRITEPGPWARATRIANSVLKGDTYLSKIGDALNYHADYVRPSWARSLEKTGVIGHHIFYKLRDGDG